MENTYKEPVSNSHTSQEENTANISDMEYQNLIPHICEQLGISIEEFKETELQ